MKINGWITNTLTLMCLLASSSSVAANISLADWAFNVDGTIYENFSGDAMPTSGSLDASGLGTLTLEITGTGSHSVVAFFDFDIDNATNSYFNEYASTTNLSLLATGQSWEVDEPGYVFGDIYDNMLAGVLDNANSVELANPDDVSFALGWDFTLNVDEVASISFSLQGSMPTTGFYLTQTDPDSNNGVGESLYFSSVLEVKSVAAKPIPAPSTLLLFGLGLFAFNRVGIGNSKRY